jgi:polysaccharide export outer membrane protein
MAKTTRERRARLSHLALAGSILFFLGCAAPPPPPAPAARVVGAAREYVIGVPDLLEMTVWQQPDLSGSVLVRSDGKISVPLLGDIQAEGLTPEALAEQIQAALSDFVAKPHVDIAVVEMNSQVASVIGGGVVRSGTVALQRNTRVIDAIASMGGLTAFAKKSKIRILRDTPEGQIEYPFDYSAFIKGRAPASNIFLEPGDTVIVPE